MQIKKNTDNKTIIKSDKNNQPSKKLNFSSNREINSRKMKYQGLKDIKKLQKEKVAINKTKFNNSNIKFKKTEKSNNTSIDNIHLINDIRNNEKLLNKIKYLQLWWKTIYHIIKIQKYIRGLLQRVKLKELKQLNGKIYLFFKPIKRIIYKHVIENIKKNHQKKIKIESPQKKKNKAKINNINDDYFSFEKIFLTSRKLNEKQKPKIKQDKIKINNIISPQHNNLTKTKNTNKKKLKENKNVSDNMKNKQICQCFNTSSNLISNKKINPNSKNKNNTKINKAEISQKVANKTKKLIKYRNEVNNNFNKFKSYHPESLKNKSSIKGLNMSIKNDSNKKKNKDLEFISTQDLRFHYPKTLFNLYDDKPKPNNKNLIRVQKKVYKNNIHDLNEEINNLRSRSLENRPSNKKYKSFSNKIKNNNKNNTNESKGNNISDFIKVNNNNVRKDMVDWLYSWEKKNMNINKSLNKNNIKDISLLINKIISFNYKNNGGIFLNHLDKINEFNILKSNFSHYKNVIMLKKILKQLQINQHAKINKEKKEFEKLYILKKLIQKYTTLKKYIIKWKIIKNQNSKYTKEGHIYFNSNNTFNINNDIMDSSNDFLNKSQPEIRSLKINNYNSTKNKYNVSSLKSTKNNNNNINININYNLITNNNNSLEQGVYKKKKINIPKTKKYQNRSVIVGENDQEDIDTNNIINNTKDFMNNSMITRRIKIKKKENNIYFPKHIKQNYIPNEFDYLTFKNNMLFNNNYNNNNTNDIRVKNGLISKKINLKFQKIFPINNNF